MRVAIEIYLLIRQSYHVTMRFDNGMSKIASTKGGVSHLN